MVVVMGEGWQSSHGDCGGLADDGELGLIAAAVGALGGVVVRATPWARSLSEGTRELFLDGDAGDAGDAGESGAPPPQMGPVQPSGTAVQPSGTAGSSVGSGGASRGTAERVVELGLLVMAGRVPCGAAALGIASRVVDAFDGPHGALPGARRSTRERPKSQSLTSP